MQYKIENQLIGYLSIVLFAYWIKITVLTHLARFTNLMQLPGTNDGNEFLINI